MSSSLRNYAQQEIEFQGLGLRDIARIEAMIDAIEHPGASASLLLAGDPSTGKSTFSRAIHHAATKSNKDFVLLALANTRDTILSKKIV